MKGTEKIELTEKLIKSLVKDLNLSPFELMVAVHNASVHGQIFPSAFWGENDKHLTAMFEGLDATVKAAEKAS